MAKVVSLEHDRGWAGSVAAHGVPNLSVLVRQRGAPDGDPGGGPALLAEFQAAMPKLPLSPDDGHNVMHGLTWGDFVA